MVALSQLLNTQQQCRAPHQPPCVQVAHKPGQYLRGTIRGHKRTQPDGTVEYGKESDAPFGSAKWDPYEAYLVEWDAKASLGGVSCSLAVVVFTGLCRRTR